MCEVFYGEEEALIFDDSDADDIEVGIEEVGTVGGSGHPDLVERCGSVSVCGDVLRDGAEPRSGMGAAGDEIGFACVLVEEFAGVADDPLEVGAGGACKGTIPAQGW